MPSLRAQPRLHCTPSPSGRWWYQSPYLALIECPSQGGGPPLGRLVFDTTEPGAVFVLPPPEPGDDVWARLKVSAQGVLAPANYVVRYNTSGGVSWALAGWRRQQAVRLGAWSSVASLLAAAGPAPTPPPLLCSSAAAGAAGAL